VDKHPKSGVWRVRIEVPPHLRPYLNNRAVFTKTLNTKVEAEARARAPAMQAPYLHLLEQAQAAHDAAAQGASLGLALTREVAAAAIGDWAAAVRAQMTDRIWREGEAVSLAAIFPEFGEPGPLGVQKTFNHAVIETYRGAGDVVDWQEPLRKLLHRIMMERGVLVPDDDHPATKAALIVLHGAVAALAKEQRDLLEGAWSLPTGLPLLPSVQPGSASAAAPVSPVAAATPSGEAITVKQMLDRHLAKTQAPATTAYEMCLAVRRLLAFLEVDDIEVNRISHKNTDDFVAALHRLPKHMKKNDWARGFKALIADYESRRDTRPRLSRPTVAKIVNLLHAMLNSAVKRGLAQHQVFGGLVSKTDSRTVTERLPFTPMQIEAIFTAPLFTGCASADDWQKPGTFLIDDERRWLPLIAITMGIRLEEGGQLLVSDVKEQSGITFIDITEVLDAEEARGKAAGNEKSLKTAPSRRRVPVHPALVEAGFLQYVARRRIAGDVRLFPNLKRNAKGKWTAKFSEWFNREFLASVGLTSRNRRFHSFRHNFVDNAREADGVKDDVRKALVGHTSNSAHSKYGQGFSIRVLNDAMRQIEVPGLPLERLRKRDLEAA
jgi:integrase